MATTLDPTRMGLAAVQSARRRAYARAARVAVAVLIALAFISVLFALVGANPATALGAILDGSFGTAFGFGQTLMIASILALTAIAAAVPFSARMFNVGAEGQLYAGAIAATAIAFALPGLPSALHIALLLIAGALGGALWAAIPGVMRAYANANEVIVSLMLTFVATLFAEYATLSLWPSGLAENTNTFPGSALLPTISTATGVTLGAPLALIAVAAMWVLMTRTTIGFQIRATGLNAETAAISGTPVKRIQVLSFVLGGAAAGLAGAILVAGIQDSLISGGAAGFGFLGVAVALVARLSAQWLIPSALLFAVLQVGSNELPVKAGVSPAIGGVLAGIFVIVLLALGAIRLRVEDVAE